MISVVIPAYNEALFISRCLSSLVKQKTDQKFEVIVVDNGSTDSTPSVVRSFQNKLHLRIINEPVKGRGDARKAGFEAALGEIILSTDADTVVPENWIDQLSQNLINGKYGATTGGCYVNGFHPLINWFMHIGQRSHMIAYRILFGHYWLSGFNFGITRSLYMQSGGFTANMNALEDIDLSFKVQRHAVIHIVPNCSVTTSGRRFSKNFLRGCEGYYKSFFYYYFGNKSPVMSDER